MNEKSLGHNRHVRSDRRSVPINNETLYLNKMYQTVLSIKLWKVKKIWAQAALLSTLGELPRNVY